MKIYIMILNGNAEYCKNVNITNYCKDMYLSNMDGSRRHRSGKEASTNNFHLLYLSIYIKFKKRKNQSMMIKDLRVVMSE